MNQISLKNVAAFGWTLIFMGSALAQSNFPMETPAFNRKVRNLGMGNTGIAIKGTHDDSPFYNPAGLNDLDSGRIQFLGITGDMSTAATDLFGDVNDLIDDLDAAGDQPEERVRALDRFVGANTGEIKQFRFSLDIVNYARKNFAAGLIFDERLRVDFRNPTFPNFNIQNLGDVVLFVSGAHGFWDQLVQVGVTAKPTVRFAIDESDERVSSGDVLGENADGDPVLYDQFRNMKDPRFGFGLDIGFKTNLAFQGIKDNRIYKLLDPAFGLTFNDIGSPGFSGAPGNQQTINMGFAIHPDLWILKNTVALDFRGLNRERDFISKLHFGVESEFPWIVTVRAGMNQGYFAAGISLDLWVVEIDGAYYEQEVGVNNYAAGDSRFAVTLEFEI